MFKSMDNIPAGSESPSDHIKPKPIFRTAGWKIGISKYDSLAGAFFLPSTIAGEARSAKGVDSSDWLAG